MQVYQITNRKLSADEVDKVIAAAEADLRKKGIQPTEYEKDIVKKVLSGEVSREDAVKMLHQEEQPAEPVMLDMEFDPNWM